MDIRLDTRSIEPGGTLRGVIAGSPEGGVDLAVRATVTTPFDEHSIELSVSRFEDGLFDLAGPTWPLTAGGPLIRTGWAIDVLAPNGTTAASVPFELVRGDPNGAGAIAIDAVDNENLFEPHHSISPRVAAIAGSAFAIAALGAVAAFFGGRAPLGVLLAAIAVGAAAALVIGRQVERRHVVEHDIRCRCLPQPAHIDCTVRLQHPELPDVKRITASLVVVESAVWTRPTGGRAEHESLITESHARLEPLDERTWSGAIVEFPPPGTPLSWSEDADLEHWAVTWAVRFVVEVHDLPDSVHIVHLRSHLRRLDPEIGGSELGDPRILRAH